jgi:rod shape-determining protein MreC
VPLGTLDRSPPPFFKQGPSALSKLMFFSALALFFMVADSRFQVAQPVRAAVSTALFPMQWIALRPVQMVQGGGTYFVALQEAQNAQAEAVKKLTLQTQRATQVEQLTLENNRLRKLLDLREQTKTPAQAAQVLYDAPDPYTRRIVVDKGLLQGVQAGSPVIDEAGVLGQVTRVNPMSSEVTLVIDRDHAIPVLNTRTGARSVAYGDPAIHVGGLELRFMAGNADVQQGDLLATSGVDGVYPAGLPVARVSHVERSANSAFARIDCEPVALVHNTQHVMILEPILKPKPEETQIDTAQAAPKKGASR